MIHINIYSSSNSIAHLYNINLHVLIHIIYIYIYVTIYRGQIYEGRIADYIHRHELSKEAKANIQIKHIKKLKDHTDFNNISYNILNKECIHACHMLYIDKVIRYIEKGVSANIQTVRGMTPVLTCVLGGGTVTHLKRLVALGADLDAVNK